MIKDRITYSEYERGWFDCLDELQLKITSVIFDAEKDFMIKCES